jgi:hypothetical protein
VRSKKKKTIQESTGAAPTELHADGSIMLTPHEAAVLRFLYMGYVGLLVSDKEALLGLEAKGLAQHIMGGWLLTSTGKDCALRLGPGSKTPSEDPGHS